MKFFLPTQPSCQRDPWGDRKGQGPPDLDEVIRNFWNSLRKMLFGGSGGRGGSAKGERTNFRPGRIIQAGLLGLVLLWLVMGVFQVDQQERAVVIRLGAFLKTVGAGLHWQPWLIDSVNQINVTRVNSISHRALMLTEDENIVDVSISVQYVIEDPKSFLLKVRDPINSLQQSTESALRHVVGSTKMDQILTNSDAAREQIALDVQDRLQDYMNRYLTGLRIEEVNIEEPQPPQAVKAAFDDVLKALEDETRVKNEAETYAKGIVPEARGQARRLMEEAVAEKEQKIARADGEAERFTKLLMEYQLAPKVTRQRLYLDALQSVFAQSSKVMVDVNKGNNMFYVPLDVINRSNQNKDGQASSQQEQEELRNLTDKVLDEIRQRQGSGNSLRQRDRR